MEITWPLVCRRLVLCGKLEEDLRLLVGCFVEVCRRRELKVNAGRSMLMVLGKEYGLECTSLCRRDEIVGI